MKFLFVSVLMLLSMNVFAGAPTCHSHSSGPYCRYEGKVKSVYINAGNLILLYFDTPLDLSRASNAGISVSNGTATAYQLDDNPEFAKLFYSTALSAQATGRKVNIQMRNTVNGYLKFDRIWLNE